MRYRVYVTFKRAETQANHYVDVLETTLYVVINQGDEETVLAEVKQWLKAVFPGAELSRISIHSCN